MVHSRCPPDTMECSDYIRPPTRPPSATVAYVLGVLTNGGNFRLVITPADPNVSATYAGFSNTMYEGLTVAGPTLTLDVSF